MPSYVEKFMDEIAPLMAREQEEMKFLATGMYEEDPTVVGGHSILWGRNESGALFVRPINLDLKSGDSGKWEKITEEQYTKRYPNAIVPASIEDYQSPPEE